MRSTALPAWLAAALLLAGIASPDAREAVRKIPGVSGGQADTPLRDAPLADAPLRSAPSAREATPGQPSAAPVPNVPSTGVTMAAPARDTERAGLTVMVNRAKVIRLPERSQTVVVGNPAVADLSLQKNGIVIVTGKSYGVTNLLALDAAGNMLAESLVNVVPQSEGVVVVQRAFERYSYSCTPNCQPSVNLGDNNTYFNEARTQADAHNQFAVSR